MAAPDYVPVDPGAPKYYVSPPRSRDGWTATRPGDLVDGQPEGAGLGHQGPDQGYALKLVRKFEDDVVLQPGETWADVAAGCVLVALKRASLHGRAPVIHDLDVAFSLWGFFDDTPDPELVRLRREAFTGVANAHHYVERRRLVDAVAAGALRATPAHALEQHSKDWRIPLDVEALTAATPAPG